MSISVILLQIEQVVIYCIYTSPTPQPPQPCHCLTKELVSPQPTHTSPSVDYEAHAVTTAQDTFYDIIKLSKP